MQPLFITGEKRSGTSFLANLLNTQAQAVVFADTLGSLFLAAKQLDIRDLRHPLTSREKNVLISNIIAEGRSRNVDFSTIQRDECSALYDIFLAALRIIKGNSGASVVGVKCTQEREMARKLLHEGSKVIYCVRDPRDVVYSSKNRFAQHNLFATAEQWLEGFQFIESMKGKENFLLVKYEELILKKNKVATEISAELRPELCRYLCGKVLK